MYSINLKNMRPATSNAIMASMAIIQMKNDRRELVAGIITWS